MPDHVHLIVRCEAFDELPRFMQDIHQRYAFYFNSKYQRPGKLWHSRFKNIPLADFPSSYEWSGSGNVLDALGGEILTHGKSLDLFG